MPDTAIIWFRQDLRLADNPALLAACEHERVLPLYIHDDRNDSRWALGGAQKVWLHFSLLALDKALRDKGSRLLVRTGPHAETLQAVVDETGADAVYWNRQYEPESIVRDRQIKADLDDAGLTVKSFNGALLHEPWQVENKSGDPYKVFTPFWKAASQLSVSAPLAAPDALPAVASQYGSANVDELALLPDIAWDAGIREWWQPGEDGAHEALEAFIGEPISDYKTDRDKPARPGTSRLSPHLHFGEIGPRQVWHRVHEYTSRASRHGAQAGSETFLSEIGWREFAYHLLYHFPHTPEQPLDERFKDFPWSRARKPLAAWQQGQTGIPMVDAAMRQLWHTGWMHNRLRMVVASFLTKNLLIPWQKGAEWFWDTLVDADLASNTLGWQWTAGCGADAAPFFRVFNPVRQGERFDPKGDFVREWVPELAELPDKHVHAPWDAPADVLKKAGVTLGRDYPEPLVDLKASRREALDAFAIIKNG